MRPEGVTIVTQEQLAVLTDSGTARRVIRIRFRVDDQGPFVVEIPVADFTAEAAHREMARISNEVRKV